VKRFAFPLDTARTWRRRQLEVEELRLHRIFVERQAIVARSHALDTELAQEEGLLSSSRLDSEALAALDGFRKYVTERRRQIAIEMRACEQKISAQRRAVVEARRRFQLLERLREKALVEWRVAESREQEQLASELFLARCVRERTG